MLTRAVGGAAAVSNSLLKLDILSHLPHYSVLIIYDCNFGQYAFLFRIIYLDLPCLPDLASGNASFETIHRRAESVTKLGNDKMLSYMERSLCRLGSRFGSRSCGALTSAR